MYSKNNELSFELLNTVIYHLYDSGEYRGARLIERKRDNQAMETYDKALKKKEERQEVYDVIGKKVVINEQDNLKDPLGLIKKQMGMIYDLSNAPILHKVYYIVIVNRVKLKQITTIREVYDRVTYLYLYSFEGWREENTFTREALGDIRAAFASVERSIRFIKEDKPQLFHAAVIKEARANEDESKDQFGNNVVGI